MQLQGNVREGGGGDGMVILAPTLLKSGPDPKSFWWNEYCLPNCLPKSETNEPTKDFCDNLLPFQLFFLPSFAIDSLGKK